HIIEQLQHHPFPPICLDQNQVQSLTDNLNFLQIFLEQGYPCVGISKEAIDVFESRIADAAEDIIETRQLVLMSWKKISSVNLYRDLDKVIQDMGLIKKDAMEIKDDNIGIIEDHLHINSSTLAGAASSRSPLTTKQETMVGFDELLIEVMDKLTRQQSNLRIIPIVGMGGIGKTTLVRNAYAKPLIVHHFDCRTPRSFTVT
ncbi:hypothetical protein MIMGU_mgv11b018434mg, partial [Erythranthe guttata]